MKEPIRTNLASLTLYMAAVHTGPTRSGTMMDSNATLNRMKPKPINVTMFGASHNGSNLTDPFHCTVIS